MRRSLKKLLQSEVAYEREFAERLVRQLAGGTTIHDGETYDKALAGASALWDEALSLFLRSNAPTVAQAERQTMKALSSYITSWNDHIKQGWHVQPDGSLLPP